MDLWEKIIPFIPEDYFILCIFFTLKIFVDFEVNYISFRYIIRKINNMQIICPIDPNLRMLSFVEFEKRNKLEVHLSAQIEAKG
jgi:hypothetical protein